MILPLVRKDSLFYEILPLEIQRHVDQNDERWYFDEGTDNGGKGLAGVQTEDSDGDGDGKFEVIRCGGEGYSCRLRKGGAYLRAMKKVTNHMIPKYNVSGRCPPNPAAAQ